MQATSDEPEMNVAGATAAAPVKSESVLGQLGEAPSMGIAGAQAANTDASASSATAPAAQPGFPLVSALPSTGDLAPAAGFGLGLGLIAFAIGMIWMRQRRGTT